MQSRLVRAVALSALAALFVSPLGTTRVGAQATPHTLIIGDNQDIQGLNPDIESAASVAYMSQLTMAKFVRYDKNSRAVPELITVVPTQQNGGISKDGLTITWHIRKGVKWSDGAPFDADDVVFSTNVVNNPKNNVIGRDGWDLITKTDEPDKYTVRYHLKKKYSSFLPTFFGTAGANPAILPKHILGNLPDINQAPYNALPVGIGPFRYTKWNRGDSVEMEANPYYWRGKPKLQRIVYKIVPDRNTLLSQMTTGEIQLIPYVGEGFYPQMKAIPGRTTIKFPSYFWSFLTLNLAHPALKEIVVRRALRLAMDRPSIVEKAYRGLGFLTDGLQPPDSPIYTPFPQERFNVDAANAMLDKAGWKRGADGIRAKDGVRLDLDFAIYSGASDTDVQNELIRSTWKQIGVAMTIKKYAPALFFGAFADGGIIYSGKYDVTGFSYGLDALGDYSNFASCAQFPPNGQNSGHYCDPEAERLLNAVKGEYDESKRKALVAAVTKKLIEDVPFITIRMRESIFTYNNAVKGFAPNAVTPFDDMMNVDV
jgi:peptide/nickel transport system substrate-binding protein